MRTRPRPDVGPARRYLEPPREEVPFLAPADLVAPVLLDAPPVLFLAAVPDERVSDVLERDAVLFLAPVELLVAVRFVPLG